MDIAGFTQKVVSLEAELQDISSQETKDEASLAKVKKQLRDLEAKVKDQEEELDEQAGSIQMLEQVPEGRPREGQGAAGSIATLTVSTGHPPGKGKVHIIHSPSSFTHSPTHKMLCEYLVGASHNVEIVKLPWRFSQKQVWVGKI